MPDNVTTKIIKDHLLGGKLAPGEEIALRVDQTLLQDATGTMASLQFEELGMEPVAVTWRPAWRASPSSSRPRWSWAWSCEGSYRPGRRLRTSSWRSSGGEGCVRAWAGFSSSTATVSPV